MIRSKAKYQLYIMGVIGTVFIFSLVPFQTVMAGSINSNESQVISVLSSTFEYNGVSYRALPEYLQMSKEYLASEEINLTNNQAQSAISDIYANVGTAVENGYIVPLANISVDTEENSQVNIDELDPKIDEELKEHLQVGLANIFGEEDDLDTTTESKSIEVTTDITLAKVSVKSQAGESLIVVPTVIKNTGYSSLSLFLTIAGIVLFAFALMIVTKKCQFLANTDE